MPILTEGQELAQFQVPHNLLHTAAPPGSAGGTAAVSTAQHCQSHSVCSLCRRIENQGVATSREKSGFKQEWDAFFCKTSVV